MIKKLLCASLIALGIALETYFYSFRFIAEGWPVAVAIMTGLALDVLLAFTVYNSKASKRYAAVAIAITMYAVVQTSAGQTFALLSHTASIGVETEASTATFTITQCKENLERLTVEANTITAQLKSLNTTEARAAYAGTISRANSRLAEITRERTRLMDILLKTTNETVTDARTEDQNKSIYGFYAGMIHWKKDEWLKFVFHFVLSILIAIMAPIGIITWGRKTITAAFSRQQIETFVAAAWYRIRNNTGSSVLSEVEYNGLLQKRNYAVEAGVYFSLMNRCVQLGLVNAGGYAVEKDYQRIVDKLSGERSSVWKTICEKAKALMKGLAPVA